VIRTFDRDVINSFLSQEDILPEFCLIKGDPKDFSDIYFMLGKAGLFPCVKHGKAMSAHAAFPKDARGRDALIDGRNLIKWVFDNTDCKTLTTRADKTKKHLLHYNAKLLKRSGEDGTYIYYEVKR
jgi:hypothetical protein